ncbi:MAG: FlgD immunoglobulin-like domain containing protein [Calditrichia bacterium]
MKLAPTLFLLLLFLQLSFAQTIIEDNPPRINQPYSLTITPPTSGDWSFNLICYRQGGEQTYTIVNLVESGSTFRATVPSEFMTERGLEFFVSFSDLVNTINVPAGTNDNNPAIVRINADNYITNRISLPVNTYRMVSVPLQLRSSDIEDVLFDDLGQYDIEKWRLFRWSNIQEEKQTGYQEFPLIPARFVPGNAFWLISEDGGFFDVDSGLTLDASVTQNVFLQTGWNQIGNPFAFNFAWSDVASEGNLQGPYFYDGTEFTIADTLEPWNGYFVFNSGNAVNLNFRTRDGGGGEGEFVKRATEAPVYALNLSASAEGRYRDSHNRIGWNLSGVDTELREPPAISENIQLSILDNDIHYMEKISAEQSFQGSWKLMLKAPPKALTVSIDLTEEGELPADSDIFILDRSRRQALLSKGEMRFTVELQANESRELLLLIGDKEWSDKHSEGIPLLPVDYSLAQNYPNPFNPETVIRYRLNQQTEVSLQVYNLLGQMVKTLVAGSQDVGEHSVRWDGRDSNGYPVSSGVYLYRLTADEFTATRKMMLVR